MGYSKEVIREALEWDGSSAIDGTDPDWYHDILEKADPKIVASVRKELKQEWENMRPSHLSRTIEPSRRKTSRRAKEIAERKYRLSLPFHFIQD